MRASGSDGRERARAGRLGGVEGSRTPDLLIANETLYQLSYDPNLAGGAAEVRPARWDNGLAARWGKWKTLGTCPQRRRGGTAYQAVAGGNLPPA